MQTSQANYKGRPAAVMADTKAEARPHLGGAAGNPLERITFCNPLARFAELIVYHPNAQESKEKIERIQRSTVSYLRNSLHESSELVHSPSPFSPPIQGGEVRT
jgi:hypothetical protein